MAKVTKGKKKRTTDSRTGCVTTRCCVECPRPTRRRRRRKLASRSLPLSRAMPMPLPSLQNIMPTPFMPLNVPLPRVEANRRPYGTHQENNQPFRTQQEEDRRLGTVRDSQARGITNQQQPITNIPSTIPKPRITNPNLTAERRLAMFRRTVSEGSATTMGQSSPAEREIPNLLDLQSGMDVTAVSNQGQNLRQNIGNDVAAREIMAMTSRSPTPSQASMSSVAPFDYFESMKTPRTTETLSPSLVQGPVSLSNVSVIPKLTSQQSQGTMSTQSFSTGGFGGRMASDTSNDMSSPMDA